jgi:penicillin-binding protein 2
MIIFDQLKKNDPYLRAITWGVLAGMGILMAGLWWVQIISYRQYSENQKTQSFRTVRIPAIRGKILDRNGTPLAENKPSYNVILYLDELRDLFSAEYARSRPMRIVTNDLPFWKRWLGFSPVQREFVKLKKPQVQQLTSQSRYRVVSNIVLQVAAALRQPIAFSFEDFMKHYTNQLALPMPILVGLDEGQVARLLEHSVNPRGVDLEIQPARYYPYRSAAAHILGYLRLDNRSMEGEVADFNFRLPDYRGHVGIEGEFDSELRGKAGVKSVLVNSLGYRQSENVWTPAEPGKNVILTIDTTIQMAAESALNPPCLQRAAPSWSWTPTTAMCSRWPRAPLTIRTCGCGRSRRTNGLS